jgi:hypothetical protein
MFHDFVDEVEHWKIRWALVYHKPETLLDTLHATNSDLYPARYSIISILLTMTVSSATSEISFSAMRRLKSYLKSTMGDEQLSNLSFVHIYRPVKVDMDMIIDDLVSRRNLCLDFLSTYTMNNSE